MNAGSPPAARDAQTRVPELPVGRRPSGSAPPLPRHIERSGLIWLAVAIVTTGAAVTVFGGGC